MKKAALALTLSIVSVSSLQSSKSSLLFWLHRRKATQMKRKVCVAVCVVVLFIDKALAFTPDIHEEICQNALHDITITVNGVSRSFSEKAINQIRDDNTNTDILYVGIPYLHFDNENFLRATDHLNTAKKEIISKITELALSPVLPGLFARSSLGQSLHALQDFYAHSNWVEIGHIDEINTILGRTTMNDPPKTTAFCLPNDPTTLDGAGKTALTSGYFPASGCGTPPPGKCTHGSPSLIPCDHRGLNKDDLGRAGYKTAHDLAIKATTDYLSQIFNDLLSKQELSEEEKANSIKKLMQFNGTYGLVVDNTGSMGEEIEKLKKQIRHYVNELLPVDVNREPDEFLLVLFGDSPHVGVPYNAGVPYITTDANAFLSAVDSIYPSEGGDCPEYSQSGLLSAISASRNDSHLFLYTDASAKDEYLANLVNYLAEKKRIKITVVATGSCSPISPAYYKNAEDTGGQLFVLNPDELDKVFNLVRPQLSGDFVTIARTKGTFDSDSKLLAAPVDSTVSTVVFSATMDTKGEVTLTRPNGNLVQNGDPGVTITELSNSTIITVNEPELGEWRLSSSGSGNFTMSAQANSPLDIYTFEFVELFAPAGGYRPIAGQPVANTAPIVQAHLIGQYQNAAFRFVDESGTTIQSLSLAKGYPLMASDEFAGTVTLPDVPFRVAVSGTDAAGNHYERLYPTLFRAQTVKVSLDAATEFANLPVGVTTTLRFKVENLSDSTAEFRMNAVDSKSFLTRTAPKELTLASGEATFFEIDLLPPKDVASNVDVSLTVTATNTSNTDVTNSATVELLTVSNYSKIFFPIVLSGKFFFIPAMKSNLVPVSVNTVTSLTGRVWMDRNLGASRVATSMTDEQAYGDLYQWGRLADGHQKRTSGTTATVSSTDAPGHDKFILAADWRSPRNQQLWQGINGVNNPCPNGFRLPIYDEWQLEMNSWSSKNAAGAFASPLKLTMSGSRHYSNGGIGGIGSTGYYWSSKNPANPYAIYFDSSSVSGLASYYGIGFSVRCIKD